MESSIKLERFLICFDKCFFKNKLFPTIHLYWKKYQQDTMTKLKATGQTLAIAGDGRHDSMGHSAKYCAYTLFCCTLPVIIDFSLIQVRVTGVNGKPSVLFCSNDK